MLVVKRASESRIGFANQNLEDTDTNQRGSDPVFEEKFIRLCAIIVEVIPITKGLAVRI